MLLGSRRWIARRRRTAPARLATTAARVAEDVGSNGRTDGTGWSFSG
jgi:hypothetical protein